jgi:catalase
MASSLVFELSKVETAHVREAIVGHLLNIDDGLARRVADGLGLAKMPPPARAAVAAIDMAPSPALQIIGKMRETLQGRCIGILIHDGTDAAALKKIQDAAEKAGASVKIVAPKVGGAKLSDGRIRAADGQLAGTPSVVFDAIAVLLSDTGAAALSKEGAAIDFVRDAFGHLKAIAADAGGMRLLKAASIVGDAGVVDANDPRAFVKAAMTRQWKREPKVRTLA